MSRTRRASLTSKRRSALSKTVTQYDMRARAQLTAATLGSAWRHRHLIRLLAAREIEARYRGAFFGMVWAVLVPLITAFAFTFVFSDILSLRAATSASGRPIDYPLTLFAGIVLFTFFAEIFGRAPGLLTENVAYVKRIRFPLDALVWSSTGAALFNLLVGLGAVLALYAFRIGAPPWSLLALPLIIAPYALMAVGFNFLLAATGVYVRDLRLLAGPLTTLLMFLAPVFYNLENAPAPYRAWLLLNPVTVPIRDAKAALFDAAWPEPAPLLIYSACALAVALLGRLWFAFTRDGFADVV